MTFAVFPKKRLVELGEHHETIAWPDCICVVRAVSVGSAAAQPQSDTDAAAFPNRAIKIVVPFPAGGPSDMLARMIGQRMSEDWSQLVLIENQVGPK